MDWSSFVLGIIASFLVSTVAALLLAALAWPGDREEDDLP